MANRAESEMNTAPGKPGTARGEVSAEWFTDLVKRQNKGAERSSHPGLRLIYVRRPAPLLPFPVGNPVRAADEEESGCFHLQRLPI